MAALPMKIAISGSAGTGKTTLATALAAKRGCSFVAEHFDDFFDDNAAFIKPARRLQQRIIATLEQKDAIENHCGDFVADRCAIDLFNLWLSLGYGVSEKKTAELYKRCRAYITKYDRIVVLPWGALPLTQVEPAVGRRRRVMNRWHQLFNHSTMVGLLQQWVEPSRVTMVPFEMTEIDARVKLVLGTLN